MSGCDNGSGGIFKRQTGSGQEQKKCGTDYNVCVLQSQRQVKDMMLRQKASTHNLKDPLSAMPKNVMSVPQRTFKHSDNEPQGFLFVFVLQTFLFIHNHFRHLWHINSSRENQISSNFKKSFTILFPGEIPVTGERLFKSIKVISLSLLQHENDFS